MTRTLFRFVVGAAVAAVLSAGGVLVWAIDQPMPPSLYKPELKRDLTQEQRWALDVEIANEASMKNHNSRRFDAPGSFEKRARWFESTAQWYQIADLMQQMIDFRKSTMRDNEKAFNELVELGKMGDVGATCIAWFFYRHFDKAATVKWKYTYEDMAKATLKFKDSGHPICGYVEGALYSDGHLGYEKNAEKAKPFMIRLALNDFFPVREDLKRAHLFEALRFIPRDVALNLCWHRVADQVSPYALFGGECESYRSGFIFDENIKRIPVPPEIQKIASEWCEPNRIVTAQTCADLENKTEEK